MKNIKIILGFFILGVVGFWVVNKMLSNQGLKESAAAEKSESKFYWTCPMHPQIHEEHQGDCPICHMRLVKITQEASAATDKRSHVTTNSEQLSLIGVQKIKVQKMDLKIKIPVSGRLTSSSTLVFQLYENDARYVRRGLEFKGESSFVSEEIISGIITAIDTIVDPTSRTIRVVGSVKKGPNFLPPESSFSGVIEVNLKNKLVIPEEAVVHTGSKDIVYYFIEPNKLAPKTVRVGIKSEGYYEVISGLELGEEISSGPNFLIDSEAQIRGAND